ncbi:(deoxy)nucleoside triphosphate pyrophosphohydrolase [Microbacterium oleivorans]|uniref:8-oxo-dGTP diphosphatase n=1 Tax=Microbacterium oleivorans TaxID=273677 RepID=A0A7D5IW47_9MICO|nr:(deoxy)nucleoside triphosphate pyrophosphohydrolase [Microbacterium oleivorans]QLD11662.1 (deoxy)nucleoside triphosphate pyrophosphohydrolase [Microbacterium oleivorans]
MRKVLLVAAAVIFDGDRVLACRRSPDKAAGGQWEFPGGKVEAGEVPEEAVRREICEELATDIRVVGELTTADTEVGEVTIRLICLRAQLMSDPPLSSTDHDRMVWIPVEELGSLDWAMPDLPAVEMLMSERA